MVRKEMMVEKSNLGGTGKGTARVYNIISQEEMYGHGRMYARIVLPPGASVGWHTHIGETEPYYILKGTAEFIDTDGSCTTVTAGDCCIIKPGDSHSLENNSDEDVEFMALIYND